MCLVLSTIYNHVFSCFCMLETYSRERLGVAKSHNAPKFSMYFYEHAECLIAVCFQIFPKVSSRSYTLLVFTTSKSDRGHQVSGCLFSGVFSHKSHKMHTLSSPKVSIFVFKNQKSPEHFRLSKISFQVGPQKWFPFVDPIQKWFISRTSRGGSSSFFCRKLG